MRRDPSDSNYDLVVLLIEDALYLANTDKAQRLRARVRDALLEFYRFQQDWLSAAGMQISGLNSADIASACERITTRTGLFIRALMEFDEAMPTREVQTAARLFGWSDFNRSGPLRAILLHVGALVEEEVMALCLKRIIRHG
jgi:hypothetical protein